MGRFAGPTSSRIWSWSVDQLPGPNQEPLPLRGEADPARGPHEERGVQALLEPSDVAADGLLGHEQPLRGAGEVQLLGHGHEVAQRADVDLRVAQ